jgi:hypothetical protein
MDFHNHPRSSNNCDRCSQLGDLQLGGAERQRKSEWIIDGDMV